MAEIKEILPPSRLLLTVEDGAAELRLSRARVYELVASGEIPSIKIGKSRRIPVDALKEWIARQVEEQCGRAA